MMKVSIQEYADHMLAPVFRQPVKTLDAALDAVGWERGVNLPTCCGAHVEVRSFIGSPYFAECKTCGRFILDVTGPQFRNSYVNLIDPEKVDTDADARWITGAAGQADTIGDKTP